MIDPSQGMQKQLGFRRNIYREWMDAAAAFCTESDDAGALRSRLDPIVREQVASAENRGYALTILLNIWLHSRERFPALRAAALEQFAHSTAAGDRLLLHYGMTLLAYDLFRRGVVIVGQLSRNADLITPKQVKQRMYAELGQMGGLPNATERILFTLRNWGILASGEQRYTYVPQRRAFAATTPALEEWLLAAVLTAHPAEELPAADLLRLPELFPFRLKMTPDLLRRSRWFEVQRQGAGWDVVRVVSHLKR